MSSSVGTGNLSQCTIAGQDVRSLVSMLDYFESIYSPAASCNITLNDASGFHNKAQLKGGTEEVSITFGGREGNTIRMNFKVGKIGDRMRAKENQDTYIITCVPQEFIENNQKEIVKAYKDKKLSDMTKDWHEEYIKESNTLKKDLVTNEESEDKQNYFGTGRSPTTAIRWAAKEAKSKDAKASNYVYYQDRDGYHFRTIDKMLSEDVKYTLTYSHQNIGAAGGDAARKIISYDQKSDFDSMDSSYNGADSDHWYYFDPSVGKVDAVKEGKRDGAGDTTHTGSAQLTSKQKSARGERFNFIVAPGQGQSKFRDSRDKKISENKRSLPEHGAKSSAAIQLDNLIINVRVPGDTNYKPGVKVRLDIPANQENSELDPRSGTFLVTSVRHITYRDENDLKYECLLECKSDSQNKSSSGNSGVTK
jgi:phosphopantetheinyl transferase (holo-ACP synthase)